MKWINLTEEQKFLDYLEDCRQRDDIDLPHITFQEHCEIESKRRQDC